MNKVTLKTHVLDGHRIGYSSETVFVIQSGRGRGRYVNRMAIKGDLARAVSWYNALNIGNGYKKRLVSWHLNRPILARHFST